MCAYEDQVVVNAIDSLRVSGLDVNRDHTSPHVQCEKLLC